GPQKGWSASSEADCYGGELTSLPTTEKSPSTHINTMDRPRKLSRHLNQSSCYLDIFPSPQPPSFISVAQAQHNHGLNLDRYSHRLNPGQMPKADWQGQLHRVVRGHAIKPDHCRLLGHRQRRRGSPCQAGALLHISEQAYRC